MNARTLINILRAVLTEGKRHLAEPNQDITDIEKILCRYPHEGDRHVSGRQERIDEARKAQTRRYLDNHF